MKKNVLDRILEATKGIDHEYQTNKGGFKSNEP